MLYPEVFSYCWIIISNKYVKQVVLINHNWITPTLQKGWELEFCLFFKKWGRVYFSPKKRKVDIIVGEWRLLRKNNLCLLAGLCVYKSKKHYIPGIYTYIYIYIYIYNIYIYMCVYVCVSAFMYVYVCMCVYVSMYKCIYVYMC